MFDNFFCKTIQISIFGSFLQFWVKKKVYHGIWVTHPWKKGKLVNFNLEKKGQKIAHRLNFVAKLFLGGQYHLLIGYGWWSTQRAMEDDQHTKGWREGVSISCLGTHKIMSQIFILWKCEHATLDGISCILLDT